MSTWSHPSFLRTRVAEQSPRSCPDSAGPQAGLGRFCGEPVLQGSLSSQPCRERAIGESVRQQADQGVHAVSETRDLFPFASQRLLGEEDRGKVGVRCDSSTFRHPSTSSGTAGSPTELRDQAQDTAGSTNLGTGRSLNFWKGFGSGGHAVRVGGISRIVLYVNPYLIRLVISGRYFKKGGFHTAVFKRRNSRTA